MYIYSDQPLAHLSYTFSVKPETCFPLQVAPILGRWKKTPRSPKLFVCIFWVFFMCFCHGKSPWNDDIKTTIWENMCGMFFPFASWPVANPRCCGWISKHLITITSNFGHPPSSPHNASLEPPGKKSLKLHDDFVLRLTQRLPPTPIPGAQGPAMGWSK